MPNFFIPAENFFSDYAIISGEDVHHLRHVLRLKEADAIVISAENRGSFRGLIETISARQIRVRILEQLPSPCLQNSVTLVQAIPRHAKMDLILQKATELGVEEIIPLATSRSFTNDERTVAQGRWRRWQKICQEAAKQCGRNNIPKLHPPAKLPALGLAGGDNVLRLLLWEKEKHNCLKFILARHKDANKIILLVGPEGSFSTQEVQMAVRNGFIPVSCAPWILRTETAAIYALSIIQYEFNF